MCFYKMSTLIFLKGVYKRDFENEVYDDKEIIVEDICHYESSDSLDVIMLEDFNKTESKNIEIIKEQKIPMYFTGVDTWLEKTNIRCWNCFGPCPDIPLFIPKNMTKQILTKFPPTEVETIEVLGIFCTLPCVRSGIESGKYHNINKYDSIWLSEYVYKLLYKKIVKYIPLAYNPYKKKCFVGAHGLSDEDYIKKNNDKLKNHLVNFV